MDAFEVVDTAPISPGQERLLAAEFAIADGLWPDARDESRLRPVDIGLVRLRGELDVASLEAALSQLIERQAALRTTFRLPPHGLPVQVIGPVRMYRLAVRSLSHEPDDLRKLLRKTAVDPRRTRLFEATLFRLSPTHYVLALEIHHLVSDGWSIGVIYRDLSELYNAVVSGRSPRLPILATTFAEQSVFMHRSRHDSVMESQVDYWRAEIGGRWPRIWQRHSSTEEVEVDEAPVTIDADTLQRIGDLSRGLSQRGGLAGPILAALAATVSLQTGAHDVRMGTMVSNRRDLAREALIGYFVNIVVIRLQIYSEMTLRQLVSQVNRKVTAAADCQEVPIQDVIARLRAETPQDEEPYEITVALNNMRQTTLTLDGLTCSDIPEAGLGVRLASTRIKQRWLLEQSGSDLVGTLTYQTAVFRPDEARRYIAGFESILRSVVQGDIDRTISDLRACR